MDYLQYKEEEQEELKIITSEVLNLIINGLPSIRIRRS